MATFYRYPPEMVCVWREKLLFGNFSHNQGQLAVESDLFDLLPSGK